MISNGFDWKAWGNVKVHIPDDLKLGNFIAKGSRGEVYDATSGADGGVAVKVLRDFARAVYSCDERYKKDYLLCVARELDLHKRVEEGGTGKTSCVIRLIRAYRSEDKIDLHLVLEKAKCSVRHHISEHSRVPEAEAKRIVAQLLKALDAIHSQAGYAHLDVNSSNVLLLPDGGIRLSDFTFCRPLGAPLNTASLVALGYRCPELLFLGGFGGRSALIANLAVAHAEADGTADTIPLDIRNACNAIDLSKADIFSAGVLLCEMLLGGLPVTAIDDTAKSAAIAHAAAGKETPPPVEADVAARRQFTALFKSLIPTFDGSYWEQRCAAYAEMRKHYPSLQGECDELPLDGLQISEEDLTEFKIKPKVTETLSDEGHLSAAGMNILLKMLSEKPENRPSARELLEHDWFKDVACDISLPQQGAIPSKAPELEKLSFDDLLAQVEAMSPEVTAKFVEVPKH